MSLLQQEREAKALERERRTQRIVNAYHRVLDNPDGEVVLADLRTAFGIDLPAFLPMAGGDAYNPYYAAIRDGQRQVWLHIQARLDATVTGDENLVTPRAIVITGDANGSEPQP